MAKKKNQSGLEIKGISPNMLLQQVESAAPYLFKGELNSSTKETAFIEKLRFYKKNLKQLNHINLSEYFHICLCAHWSTAGSFVPTDVDNQIREGLWLHKDIAKNIEKMTKLTIESWKWDYSQVSDRKMMNPRNQEYMSTHEGTWLSVAIGAYCALKKYKRDDLAQDVADIIWQEILKEYKLLEDLKEQQDHINFIKATPLIAHNLGDLDRVIVQWGMEDKDDFCKKIFKLGHFVNDQNMALFVYSGKVNKEFTAKENHRHLSLRQAKSLRKSYKFLVPVGPFMDDWGIQLGQSDKLSLIEKAEIITALFDGFNRQEEAFGYARAFGQIVKNSPNGFSEIETNLPFDLVAEIKKSQFSTIANLSQIEFENGYIERLNKFVCPETKISFN